MDTQIIEMVPLWPGGVPGAVPGAPEERESWLAPPEPEAPFRTIPVSYTHLTLPTNREV